MNIALTTIYGSIYANDRIFDPKSCVIGENLLIPGIELKHYFEKKGHQYHTIDTFQNNHIDFIVFHDINPSWFICREKLTDKLKYILKLKWKNDEFAQAARITSPEQRMLIIQEPPVVNPLSYDRKYHDHFKKILTWDDDLVDNIKYYKYFYPQVIPSVKYSIPFEQKKELVMICANKESNGENELYSARKKTIHYFEGKNYSFDLYGFGWENEALKNYQGITKAKLTTMANYKFSICYENMCGIRGYITEKIFDCFFSGCVPVYWGAENISDYIPEKAYIDRRRFDSLDQMMDTLLSMSKVEYEEYIHCAQEFIYGEKFNATFSVEAYVNNIYKSILCN